MRLLSRNRTLFNDIYPVVIDALKSLKAKSLIIDGEVAALDQQGRSSFQLLQSYGTRTGILLVYYAFSTSVLVAHQKASQQEAAISYPSTALWGMPSA